ncbi:MAG TPA: PAS domain S-box protein [Methanoregula sp.]|nr:PAS domain S-box protein [Methanoregula sp.]
MFSVLYLDDDPTLLDLTKIFLEKSGKLEVDTAQSVGEALQKTNNRNYDGIISDYEMPSINGIEFLRRIRRHYPSLPFILFTGKGREEIAIEALNNGADFYLQKGGNPKSQFAELEYNVMNAIDRKKAREELKESRQMMANMIDFLPDATFAINRENTVISWNRMMEKLTGTPSSAILGTKNYGQILGHYNENRIPLVDRILSSDTSRAGADPEKVSFGDAIISEFYSPTLYDNRGAHLWLIASPLCDTSGNVIGAIESIRDITARKEAEEKLQRTYEELNAAYEQLTATEEELRQNYTELTKNQQELVKSEERYRNVVEDQTEFICRFSPDGTHIFVNEAYCRYFNKTREEIVGHRFRPTVPAEDRVHLEKFFVSFSPGHPVGTIDHRIVMPDGSVRWQRWSDRAVFDPSGKVTEYQSVGRDITGQKESEEKLKKTLEDLNAAYEQLTVTEEELRQNYNELTKNQQELVKSEERYRNVVEDQTEFICRFSPDGTHIFVNEAYCRYFGKTREEIIGHHFAPEIPKEDLPLIWAQFKSITPDHPVQTVEHRILMPNGKIRWQQWSDRGVFDRNGRLTEYQSVGRDITGQKESEEKLKKTLEELNAAYEQLTATEEELRANYDELTRGQQELVKSEERYRNIVEDQMEFICRFSPDGSHSFVNEAYCRYFGKTREEIIGRPFAPLIPKEDLPLIRAHFKQITPDHPVQTVEHRILMPDGEIRWQQWSDRGIFDRDGRLAEYQSVGRDITDRRYTEQALHEANKKLTLLSSVTRHDILNALTSLQGYLELIETKVTDPATRTLVNRAFHTSEVIQDLISFTRQYEDIGIQNPVWQNLSLLIRGVCQDSTFRIVQVDPSISGLEIFADPLLKQVFFNLFENALMHGERVTGIVVSGSVSPDCAKIVVTDNGKGIPPRNKEKIFEKGFGVHTGLGLYLVREILSITGLTIREVGEYGKGAQFVIHIPAGKFRESSLS